MAFTFSGAFASGLREVRSAHGYFYISAGVRSRVVSVFCLLWSYVSRVEGGFTIPSLATLERWVKALVIKPYQLFSEGKGRPVAPRLPARTGLTPPARRLVRLFENLQRAQRRWLLAIAAKLASHRTDSSSWRSYHTKYALHSALAAVVRNRLMKIRPIPGGFVFGCSGPVLSK